MVTMTEAPFSVSHNFCVIRGETVKELMNNLREFNSQDEIEEEIGSFRNKVSNQSTPMGAAVAAVQDIVGGTVISQTPAAAGPEKVPGKYGDTFTYGLAEAPALPDGRGNYVLREWTDRQGKARVAFVDPVKGPRPFAPGAGEAKIIFK